MEQTAENPKFTKAKRVIKKSEKRFSYQLKNKLGLYNYGSNQII